MPGGDPKALRKVTENFSFHNFVNNQMRVASLYEKITKFPPYFILFFIQKKN